jgi:hypothetical protein
LLWNNTIIPPFIIIPKRLDPYYQANITRRDLVILREEKQRNDSRNIIAIIVLSPSPPLTPEPLEPEIPAKYLDHEPKALDLLNLTEPELNTPRKQFSPRLLGHTIY